MRIWHVLIVEDEEPARRLMKRYLQQIPNLAIEEAENGEQAMKKLEERNWDIVFLDIEMPGVDGIALMHFAQSLPSPPAVIFTTAYAEHAVKAFEGGAVDYLLKPFSFERLRQAVERAQRSPLAAPSRSLTGKLAIPRKEGHIILSYSEIVGVRVADRTLSIESHTGQVYETRAYTLQQIEERLPYPPFLRIARDALINLDAVQEVLPWFSGRFKVILRSGTIYMCSREYAPQLLRAVGLRE
ncbi:MAG: LytTR family DNA-binding domain-containing protein [Bacteroidia bacterium]|nr:LytTR family DNA-binding domain-containing protein [Bacteroidia bacterium]MDW8015647.1 LytTR family DNA-binding domain-containing protein [Bacteroidia bacterium]